MTSFSQTRYLPFILTCLIMLVVTTLACSSDTMRASEPPIWECPTPIPVATDTPMATATTKPGTPTPMPGATYTPYPTATPFVLTSDFPLARHVRIGGVGGIGFGVWVWMDSVSVIGPIEVVDPQLDTITERWIAVWDVTVENASATANYEFYPFSQIYVLEYVNRENQNIRGAFPISKEAAEVAGIEPLELDEDRAYMTPGDIETYRVAAFIPGPNVWRMAYVLDPLDTVNIEEMSTNNSLGSNVGVWINYYDQRCMGEVTPGFDSTIDPNFTPIPGTELLARPPVIGTFGLTRTWGCFAEYTGYKSPLCKAPRPNWHQGIDVAGAKGKTQVVSPFRTLAQVVWAGEDTFSSASAICLYGDPPHKGYGNVVIAVTETDGVRLKVIMAHLSRVDVKVGQTIAPGQVVGIVGSTGCSTGPHLHFSLMVGTAYQNPCQHIPGGCPIVYD